MALEASGNSISGQLSGAGDLVVGAATTLQAGTSLDSNRPLTQRLESGLLLYYFTSSIFHPLKVT